MHFATLAVTLGALSTTLFDFAKAGPTPSQELIDFNPKWETWVCYPVYDGIFVTACDCKLYNEWSPSTRKLVHNRPWPLSDGVSRVFLFSLDCWHSDSKWPFVFLSNSVLSERTTCLNGLEARPTAVLTVS